MKLFKKGSHSHVLLLIAKSQKTWFTSRVAYTISNLFQRSGSAALASKRLVEAGLLEQRIHGVFKDHEWRITPRGAAYLVEFARQDR